VLLFQVVVSYMAMMAAWDFRIITAYTLFLSLRRSHRFCLYWLQTEVDVPIGVKWFRNILSTTVICDDLLFGDEN